MNAASETVSLHEHQRALSRISELEQKKLELEAQLAWFKKQYFGVKSEKSPHLDPQQLSFGEDLQKLLPQKEETVQSYTRRVYSPREESEEGEPLLRFDETVPVETIEILPEEVKDLSPDDYKVVSEKVTHRLAQRPGSYVVLKYVRKVIKLKDEQMFSAPAPAAVLERSFADVSLLAGILVDKFLYHLPLYRQHQRLKAAGIELSRVTLTNYVHRSVSLLQSIYYAQLSHILQSKVLLMDETPIKAGNTGAGKLKQGYYWPLLGEEQEVAFPFATSRAEREAREVLGNYCGTLVTDGYKVYARVTESNELLRHAQCWVHTRRQFLKAEDVEPALVQRILSFLQQLYAIEEQIKNQKPEQRREARRTLSSPVVDQLFSFLRSELQERALLPTNPFTKAAHYALERERALRVFLDDEAVPLDTNALERALRPIPMGRKNSYDLCQRLWTRLCNTVIPRLVLVVRESDRVSLCLRWLTHSYSGIF